MGEVPDWYETIRAAKYLGVAPWDLQTQPIIWQKWAVQAEKAETISQQQREASAIRKKR